MTLYYTLVFALLMFEMAMATVLLVPLPFSMRRQLFHFLATSEIVAKINYAVRITFIFVAVLFIDAFQRMLKVHAEAAASPDHGLNDIRFENSYHAKKFYAQRNLYLTGFTLFLSLVLARMYSLILELINMQEELAGQSGVANSASGSNKKQTSDMETMRKQVNQQQAEYNRLSDELNKSQGNVSDKRKD